MFSKSTFLLAFTVVVLTSIQTKTKNTSTELLFHDAIKAGKSSASIFTNGGHDEGSVHIKISNLSSKNQSIRIPTGTIFSPLGEDEQDLLLLQDELIVLKPREQKNITLDAYCMQAENSSPVEGEKMKYKSVEVGSPLHKLSQYTNGKKINSNDLQSAVWSISDDQPFEYLNLNTPSSSNLRTEVCNIMGRKNTWFDLNANRTLTENRRVETSSSSLNGRISLKMDGPGEVHEVVKDENGNVKFTMKKCSFPKAGDYKYTFRLWVKGWEKGNYTVHVMKNDEEYMVLDFVV